MKRLKAYEIGSFPPNENPFWHDHYRMGTDVDSKLLVMHESITGKNRPYILVCKETGRRFLINLPDTRERTMYESMCLWARKWLSEVRNFIYRVIQFGFKSAIYHWELRSLSIYNDMEVPHYLVVKITLIWKLFGTIHSMKLWQRVYPIRKLMTFVINNPINTM